MPQLQLPLPPLDGFEQEQLLRQRVLPLLPRPLPVAPKGTLSTSPTATRRMTAAASWVLAGRRQQLLQLPLRLQLRVLGWLLRRYRSNSSNNKSGAPPHRVLPGGSSRQVKEP